MWLSPLTYFGGSAANVRPVTTRFWIFLTRKNMRAIVYYRVSTGEQAAAGNGLDAQADAVRTTLGARG